MSFPHPHGQTPRSSWPQYEVEQAATYFATLTAVSQLLHDATQRLAADQDPFENRVVPIGMKARVGNFPRSTITIEHWYLGEDLFYRSSLLLRLSFLRPVTQHFWLREDGQVAYTRLPAGLKPINDRSVSIPLNVGELDELSLHMLRTGLERRGPIV